MTDDNGAQNMANLPVDGLKLCPMCRELKPVSDYVENGDSTAKKSFRYLKIIRANGKRVYLRKICSACMFDLEDDD